MCDDTVRHYVKVPASISVSAFVALINSAEGVMVEVIEESKVRLRLIILPEGEIVRVARAALSKKTQAFLFDCVQLPRADFIDLYRGHGESFEKADYRAWNGLDVLHEQKVIHLKYRKTLAGSILFLGVDWRTLPWLSTKTE